MLRNSRPDLVYRHLTYRKWRLDEQLYLQPALMIESATEGQVSRAELRPHDWELIWPEYASGIRLGQTHVVHAEGDCSACLSDGVDS